MANYWRLVRLVLLWPKGSRILCFIVVCISNSSHSPSSELRWEEAVALFHPSITSAALCSCQLQLYLQTTSTYSQTIVLKQRISSCTWFPYLCLCCSRFHHKPAWKLLIQWIRCDFQLLFQLLLQVVIEGISRFFSNLLHCCIRSRNIGMHAVSWLAKAVFSRIPERITFQSCYHNL